VSFRRDAPKLTLAQYHEIEASLDDGESIRAWARKLDISRTALRQRMKALGLRTRSGMPRTLLTQMERRVWTLRSLGIPAKAVAATVRSTDGAVRQIYLIARRKLAAGNRAAARRSLRESGVTI
jgi:transposase-like protein